MGEKVSYNGGGRVSKASVVFFTTIKGVGAYDYGFGFPPPNHPKHTVSIPRSIITAITFATEAMYEDCGTRLEGSCLCRLLVETLERLWL